MRNITPTRSADRIRKMEAALFGTAVLAIWSLVITTYAVWMGI